MTASKLQPLSALSNSDDELWARLASNTPRPPIGKHVLIVGLSVLNNQLFKKLVELQGSTTILTSGGEQALQAAIEDHPDLIIVDVMGSQDFEFGKNTEGRRANAKNTIDRRIRLRQRASGCGRWL